MKNRCITRLLLGNRRSPLALVLAVTLALATAGCEDATYCDAGCGPPPDPPQYPLPDSPDDVIETLRLTYQRKDAAKFATLLHSEYQFQFNARLPDRVIIWDAAEEIRIHKRMFRPADIEPPEAPLPVDLWLQSIDIALARSGEWVEFSDATGDFAAAVYEASLFVETQGDTDFRIDDRELFTIKIEPALPDSAAGKYLLYRWMDVRPPPEREWPFGSWGGIKSMYRAPAASVQAEGRAQMRVALPLERGQYLGR